MKLKMSSEMMHQWIKVIIPIRDIPLLCALCQVCGSYFTEKVPFDASVGKAKLSTSSLPRWGCVTPKEFEGIPV